MKITETVKCECGNEVAEAPGNGIFSEFCEFCIYPETPIYKMTGYGVLQEMECHGRDKMHAVEFPGGERFHVYAMNEASAVLIAEDYFCSVTGEIVPSINVKAV